MKNRIFFLAVVFILTAITAFAQKKPKAKLVLQPKVKSTIIKQPDGTQLTVVLTNDKPPYEETLDGYTVIKNEKGIYEYALIDINCNLIVSGIKARNPKDRSALETRYLYKRGLRKHLRKDYFQE